MLRQNLLRARRNHKDPIIKRAPVSTGAFFIDAFICRRGKKKEQQKDHDLSANRLTIKHCDRKLVACETLVHKHIE